MSDDIRCFMVVDINSGDACLEYKTEKTDRRNVSKPRVIGGMTHTDSACLEPCQPASAARSSSRCSCKRSCSVGSRDRTASSLIWPALAAASLERRCFSAATHCSRSFFSCSVVSRFAASTSPCLRRTTRAAASGRRGAGATLKMPLAEKHAGRIAQIKATEPIRVASKECKHCKTTLLGAETSYALGFRKGSPCNS